MPGMPQRWQKRVPEFFQKIDLPFVMKLGIMPVLTGLVPVLATLAQSVEQTLRKRQVKGSSPLGGLANIGRPQRIRVGAFVLSSCHSRRRDG
jgi:hypothetical protein